MSSPTRISTSFTLFFGLFIPVFWIVFFGAMTIGLLLTPQLPSVLDNLYFRIGIVLFYLSGLAFLYFTLLRLKRVEIDHEFVYVTNYLKVYRYPFHNIAAIREVNLYLFRLCTIQFKEEGSFGKRIHFLESKSMLHIALEENIDLKIMYESGKEQ